MRMRRQFRVSPPVRRVAAATIGAAAAVALWVWTLRTLEELDGNIGRLDWPAANRHAARRALAHRGVRPHRTARTETRDRCPNAAAASEGHPATPRRRTGGACDGDEG